MASPAVFDLAKLTAPIAGANPCGVDLRTDMPVRNAFYEPVLTARKSALTEETKQLQGLPDASPPNWQGVVTSATKTLAEKSKDLEIVAILLQALPRIHGFAGLRDGFRLVRELVEKYWDNLYPLPDADEPQLRTPEGLKSEAGVEARFFGLIGLNGDPLTLPINRILITGVNREDFSTYDYQKAQETAKIADAKAKEKAIAGGAMSMEKIAQAVSASPNAYFKNLVEDMTAGLDELAKLNAELDAKCGSNAPGWGLVRNAMTASLDAVKDFARHKLVMDPPKTDGKSDAAGDPGAESGAPGAAKGAQTSAGPLQSRDDAFNLLTKVADFFRSTEPHSIVSYAVDQAVRWGRMPLPDLLAELITEENPRKALYKQVGIRPPEASDKKK
jgi:type VI secretion system protein ImpA